MIRLFRTACIFLFCWVFLTMGYAQRVPAEMDYCGIRLKFTAGAQEKLATYVGSLYESPRYFNEMVQRAYTYMPFIEEALAKEGVPDDLKYLAIQESSLKGDAISSSNAVGFWQFKEPAGLEFGLRIDRQIDERRHIYRSSEASGKYLKKANLDFDNWVYAVIAYYEGPTGAVSYTNPLFYTMKEMTVDENLHWYVMKAIAHKLAYQEALELRNPPKVWIQPKVAKSGSAPASLAKQHKLDLETFLTYNHWILDERRLPQGEFTYYIPHFDTPYTGHTQDPLAAPAADVTTSLPPVEVVPNPQPTTDNNNGIAVEVKTPASINPVISNSIMGPPAQPVEALPENAYARFILNRDLDYGQSFVLTDENTYLPNVSQQYDISLVKLLNYNGLNPSKPVKPNKVLYLEKAKKRLYHIVEPSQTLGSIAVIYGKKIKKLQKLNQMEKGNLVIYVGQKLHMKKKKPKGEPIIILDKKAFKPAPKPKPQPAPKPAPVQPDPATNTETQPSPTPAETNESAAASEWVEHTVQPGETLWRISKMYGTKVEIIKMVNKLPQDSISPGQKLRILAKKSILEEMKK